MIRFLSILLLLYPLPFIHTQQASDYETVKPFYELNVELAQSETKLYHIDLADRHADFDVALLALAYRGTAPQVFAAKTAEQLASPDQAPYSTKDMTGEVVYIRQEDLNNEQNIYVKLVCEASECHSHITFEYAKEIKTQTNGMKIYQNSESLKGTTLGVVRVEVPAGPDVDRIVIHAEAIPVKGELNDFKFDVMIEQGEKIPHTSRFSNIQRSSWFEGKTIVIPKDHPLFCTACSYTLNLKISEHMAITVMASAYGPNTNLTAHPILDGVQKEKYNSYVYNIRDPEDEFLIDVNLQQGNITLRIDCGLNVPNDFNKYFWRYEVLPNEEIVLTPKEHARCLNTPYYIVAYGNEDSVYSMRAMWRASATLDLKTGAKTVGDIFPGETISYDLLLPIFVADKFMFDIKKELPLDIMVTNCKFPSDCPGLIPAQLEATPTANLERNDTEFSFDLVDLSTQSHENKRVIIDPHGHGCYPILVKDKRFMNTPIPVCAYQLTLHSTQQTPVEYTLEVGNMGHEWLYPGMPKLDMVGKDNFKYYMLYVPHQDLKKVVIQFTKFSGDIDVYVSKTQQFPNQDTDDTEFSHEGMIAYTQAPLNGTYYIAVKGVQTSSYSLSTFVTGGDGEMEDYALTIQESVPQKGVILPNHEHPVQYYKFTLDQEEGWEGSLRITVNPHRGSLVMVVNSNDIIPLPTFSNWNTTKHDLEISSTDPNFKRNGTYHIGLYMDWGNQEALGWDDIPFTIVYYLQEKGKEDGGQVINKNHLLLTSSMPFYGKIKHGEIKYFEVEVNPWDKSVTIYKQSDVGGVDLYLSRDPDQLYPGPQDYTYTTAISHTNKLELNHYDVRAICQDSVVLLVCPFFMAVVPSSDLDETSFSLHISRETTAIDSMTPLEDGKRLISEVPERADRIPLYYFYPHTREYSVVTVACPGKHITIYASTKNVEIGSSFSPDIEPPTPDSYAYSSKNNNVDTVGIAHLTIPPQDELNATVVAIAVYFQSFSNISSQYSIVVSAHSTRIYTGQPYHSSVQNDSYVYFSFDVSKDNCNLLVAITTLDDGNPDLLVSYGDNLRPTIGDAQFSSISDQRTEVIEVSNLDILPLKSMAGTWTIGVYGRTASSFTLTVIYEDQKMVELKSGIPFEMLLSENSKMFFKYYHEENNDVEIRLERFSGDVVAYVLNIGENEHYQANLPNSSYNDWTIDPGFQPNLKVNTSDPEACTNCLYLIGLETRSSSKFIISVNEDVKYVKLQNGIHTRQELEPNFSRWYVFSSPNADEVYLNVYLFGSELRVYSSHNPTVNNSNYELRNVVTIGTPSYQVAIGNEEFKNDTIWDGEQEVPSRKNAFYFLFENPGTSPIKYNVIARTHETNIILRPGDRAETYISGKNLTSWVFYSSHDNELIKLILDYHVAQTGNEAQVREVAMEGLPVEANYWAEKETQGSGRVAELERDKVVEDQNIRFGMGGGGFSFREVITTTSKKGKYIFDISNPFDENIVLGVRLLRSEIGTLTLDQNYVHSSSLEKGHSETIEIFLGHRGSWYLWVFTCAGEIQVSVQDSSRELELESSIVTLPQGQEQFFRAHHPRGGVKTVTITRSPSANDDTQFYLSSSYFFEGKVYDFEPENDDYKSSISYANNVVEVSLTTVQFEELEATDRIIYSVKLCPYDEQNKEHEWNTCGSASDCQVDSHDFMINVQPQNLTARFENVAYGNYYVKTVANLYHMQKLIKFVPYAIKTLEAGPKAFLEEEVSKTDSESRATYVLIGLIVLLVIGGLGYLAYGKMKSPKSNARGEMQMQNFPAQKKQQYEAVGEEEVTIAEPGEQSEEKSEDKSEEK